MPRGADHSALVFPVYFDEDSMDGAVLRRLRADGVDARSVVDEGMQGASDIDQLAFASKRGWVIVTSNRKDYARIAAAWAASGRSHAGIVMIVQQRMPVGDQIRALRSLLSAFSAAEMVDRVEYLSYWIDGPDS